MIGTAHTWQISEIQWGKQNVCRVPSVEALYRRGVRTSYAESPCSPRGRRHGEDDPNETRNTVLQLRPSLGLLAVNRKVKHL